LEIPNTDSNTSVLTLSSKPDIEGALLARNQRHSRQSLATPFAAHPILSSSIDPLAGSHHLDEMLDGSYLNKVLSDSGLSEVELTWIQCLNKKINSKIKTDLSLEDF
jgi:hypothetical protein